MPGRQRIVMSDEHVEWVFPVSEKEELGAKPDSLNGASIEIVRDCMCELLRKYTVPVCANSFIFRNLHFYLYHLELRWEF